MNRIFLLLSVAGCILFTFSAAFGQPLNGPGENNLQSTLEYNKTDQPNNWVNPDTGETGSIVPVKTFQNSQGQYCREYRQTILIGGQKEQGYGTACRQPDGTWQIVRDESGGSGNPASTYSQAPPVEKRTYGNVYGNPYGYGYYPYYSYYPYRYYPHYPPAYYYPYAGSYYYNYPYYPYYPYGASLSFGYIYYDNHGNHSGGYHHYNGRSGHGGNHGYYHNGSSWGHGGYGGSHNHGGNSSGGGQWQGRGGHR